MPAIGLGTFGSDHFSAGEIAEVVKGAAAVEEPRETGMCRCGDLTLNAETED